MLERPLTRSPQAADAHSLLGQAQVALDRQQPEPALQRVGEVLAAAPTDAAVAVRAYALAAEAHACRQDMVQAVRCQAECAARALSAPDVALHALAHASGARVALRLGEAAAALAELQTAWPWLEGAPDAMPRLRAELLSGQVHQALGQWPQALEWLERAVESARRAGWSLWQARAQLAAAQAWLAVGEAALHKGDAMACGQAWQAVVERTDAAQPSLAAADDAAALRQLQACRGRALAQQGRHERAALDLQQAWAAACAAQDIELLATLGPARIRQTEAQRGSAAADELLAACLADPSLAEAPAARLPLLACATERAEQQGRLAQALVHLREQMSLALAEAERRARRAADVARTRWQLERARADALAVRDGARRVQEQAALDPLTGVAHRRHLDDVLAQAHAECRTRAQPLCVATIAVDALDALRGTHSPAVVEAVLRLLAKVLKGEARSRDLVARSGDETFCLVLRDVGPGLAKAVCDRFRKAVERAPWHTVVPGLQVTASFGVTDIARHADTAAGLAVAESLLARAQASGRNGIASDV